MSKKFLSALTLASRYLQWMVDSSYTIVDLNMIEPFYMEDKTHHPSSIVYERNNTMWSIRSDWTRSILHYKNRYHQNEDKLTYFGPVVRNNRTYWQAGSEIYQANIDDIIDCLLAHIQFAADHFQQGLHTMVLSDEDLIDLYIQKYELDEGIRQLIYQKNISEIGKQLGNTHPLYQLLIQPVSQQFKQIEAEFKDAKVVQWMKALLLELKDYGMKLIVDLSFRSPQSYYDGLYFNLYSKDMTLALSGGQYQPHAFGVGMNLENGGMS